MSNPVSWHKTRNERICDMRRCGVTYKDIGEWFDISQERVRQIWMKYKRKREFRQLQIEDFE